MKKVTIVLPTYNGERFLKESIESVISQNYLNWELIIVNDCSTDNTLEISNYYAEKDERIIVISNEMNLKLPASLNVGFRKATGDYYTWTSDDNIFKPFAIEKMVEYLDSNPDCDLVSFNMSYINEEGFFVKDLAEISPNRTPQDLIKYSNVGACFMYTKEIANKVGEYDINTFCAEDYDYWCRIAIDGNICYEEENLYRYRENSKSLSATKKKIIKQRTIEVREKYMLPLVQKFYPQKEEQVKFLMDLYFDEKHRAWLEMAKNIDKKLVDKLFFKKALIVFLKNIFSVTITERKRVIRILGIKITRPLGKYIEPVNNKFLNFNVRKNSVLVVEPNPYHGEILPSFTKYFQELGYNVDLFLRWENLKDNSFINIDSINIFPGSAKLLKKMLKMSKIKEYEYVFFSSSAFWETGRKSSSYLSFLGFVPKSKNGILIVEHNIVPYLKKYKELKYLKQNRLFSCSGMANVPMLSPIYYGNVKETEKSQDNITRFIVVGATAKGCKNCDLLINVVDKLVKNNISNFKVIIDGTSSLNIPVYLNRYIIENGRVDFKKMYSDMEDSDYILFLLDETLQEHNRYRQGTTTGALNLSLGFKKPAILNETFAKAYGLNDENTIIYPENDLYDAMKKAIEMSNENYIELQNNLRIHADKIYQKSLENLKKAVENGIKK